MPPSPELLATQLEAVAKRLIVRVFDTIHGHGPIQAPELYELVQRLDQTAWDADRTAALHAAIDKAARGLPVEPVKFGATLTWQQAALWLFNIEPLDLDYQGGKKYDLIFAHIFSGDKFLAHFGRAVRKDIAHKVRLLLARKLVAFVDELEMEREAIEGREHPAATAPATAQDISPVSPAADPDLIVRHQYITEVLGRVVSEDKRHFNCVCIWGEPGTGKTVLADQVARALKYEPVARLRAGNPEVFQDDLSAFFITEGIEPGNWNESDRRAHFKHRLSKSSPGRLKTEIVIIDNVDDETLLDQLVPPDPRVPTFLTMRHRPDDERIKHVELEAFTEAEAHLFIKRRLPDADGEDARSLARVLGCRPLALDHAVRFIHEAPDISLRELVQALTVDLQSNLALVTPPEQREQNLIQLYKRILASLADDQSALDVLRAFLAVAGKSGIEYRGSLLLFIQHHPREPHDRLYYHAGLRILARLGLLREDVDPRDEENVLLVMHPLTYRILGDLEASVIFRIEADYLDVLGDLEVDEAEPRRELRRAQALAQLRDWAGQVGRQVAPPGYVYFRVVDEETWVAVREAPDEHGVMQQYTVRYEVYPDRFYKLDYRDGRRSPLNLAEADELVALITAFHQAVMPELTRSQNSDDASGGRPVP